jgi:hypothetical protein
VDRRRSVPRLANPYGKDKRIRHRRAEIEAVATNKAKCFVITRGDLTSAAFAAGELARWALKPVPVARYQPKPPRLISFFSCTEGGRENSYQLTVLGNGKKAHIDGPDISADLGRDQLTDFMADVIAKWPDGQ